MAERVFVKVVGFSDVERHALNTVFRLSEQRETIYSPWMPDAPDAPQLALIDGQSNEAKLELESPRNAALKLIWVGAVAPAKAWRTFDRPIAWSEVVRAMDQLFAPPEPLDFDLGVDDGTSDTLPPPMGPAKRALIASASREERLYLRAKLALSHITQADEADTGARAKDLMRANHYDVAVLDFGLPGIDGWSFLKEFKALQPQIPHVIVTKARASLVDRARGHFSGAAALFDNPPDPGKLKQVLDRV